MIRITTEHLVNAALRYAELGYPVFPCAPGGKVPFTPHGFKDATTDAAQIEAWWRKRSSASVPESAEEAVTLANAGALCTTEAIKIRSVVGEEYARIIGHELGKKPPWREPGWDEDESGQIEPNHAHAGPVAAMAAGNEDIPY